MPGGIFHPRFCVCFFSILGQFVEDDARKVKDDMDTCQSVEAGDREF